MITDLPIAQLKIWQDNNMESKRYEYQLYHNDILIDLGAYQGEWALKMYAMYDTRVIAVEPTDAIMSISYHQGITAIKKAAWIESGTRKFGGNAYWTSSNLEHNQEYPCFDINVLLDQPIAILKVNIEGDEYEVLNHIMDLGLQKNIRNFQIQFHQTEGFKEKYDYIIERLLPTHHKTWGVDWIWENWERF